MAPEWLRADAIDEQYFRLLPGGQSTVTDEEVATLANVFGESGEADELLRKYGLTAEKIVDAARDVMKRRGRTR